MSRRASSWTALQPFVPSDTNTSTSSVRRLCGAAPIVLASALLWASPHAGLAQDGSDATRAEFWPELHAYQGWGERARLFLLASAARNRDEDYGQAFIGAHVDFFISPVFRDWLHRTPDLERRHLLTVRVGYRYGFDLSESWEHDEDRILAEATGRTPPVGRFVLANRNRIEWRQIDGAWSWRYRNRTRLEREFGLGSHALTAYAMFEISYDSRHDEWNRKRYYAGIDWPLGGRTLLDTYYCRQDDSASSVRHVDALGLSLSFYF